MRKDFVMAAVGGYVLLMAVYWFAGTSEAVWAYFYYINEKLFALFGFYLLYSNARGLFIRNVAIYCMALCLFMIAYFFFTRLFGHSDWLTVGSFLVYSFVILTWLRIR